MSVWTLGLWPPGFGPGRSASTILNSVAQHLSSRADVWSSDPSLPFPTDTCHQSDQPLVLCDFCFNHDLPLYKGGLDAPTRIYGFCAALAVAQTTPEPVPEPTRPQAHLAMLLGGLVLPDCLTRGVQRGLFTYALGDGDQKKFDTIRFNDPYVTAGHCEITDSAWL